MIYEEGSDTIRVRRYKYGTVRILFILNSLQNFAFWPISPASVRLGFAYAELWFARRIIGPLEKHFLRRISHRLRAM